MGFLGGTIKINKMRGFNSITYQMDRSKRSEGNVIYIARGDLTLKV